MKHLADVSVHRTDEQLIACLYDAGQNCEHLLTCFHCRERVKALQANRALLEREAGIAEEVDFTFLASQRRRIYARLTEPVRPRWVRRWAPAAAALLVLGRGGFMAVEQYQHQQSGNKISDVQLAQEMSSMTQTLEAQPVAPLQGLFEQ